MSAPCAGSPNGGSRMSAVVEIHRSHNPFGQTGVSPDAAGVPRYTDIPATLVDMVREHVATRPDAEAVVEIGGQRLTYAQLWERATRVAGGLRAAGVAHGDRVALRYPAGVEWVLGFWGTVLSGGVVVPVNTRSAQPEVEFVLADADTTVDLAPGHPLPDGEPYAAPDLEPTDVAALFYTSGTTGHPKGVPTTHEAFLTNTENLVRCLGMPRDVGAELRTLISVPLFHVTACNSQLLVAAYLGGTSVILPVLDLPTLIHSFAAERISFLVMVPAVYSLLLRHPRFADAEVSGIRTVGYGGAPIAPQLVRSLRRAFPRATLMNGFGMTETASLITVLSHEDAVDYADSVGFAVPSVRLGIVPLTDDPAVGELVVRGANVTTGTGDGPTPRRTRSWTVGCTPVMWCASTTPDGYSSSTGSRTSSTAAARTCPVRRSRGCCCRRPASPTRRCSAFPTM